MRDDAEIEDLNARAIAAIDSAAGDLVEVSHEIHAHPEQNYEERFAADLLAPTTRVTGDCRKTDRGPQTSRCDHIVPAAV
ncbi:MAG: hypothetical protein ACKOQ7_09415, partial [Actinomycetota bacterium]